MHVRVPHPVDIVRDVKRLVREDERLICVALLALMLGLAHKAPHGQIIQEELIPVLPLYCLLKDLGLGGVQLLRADDLLCNRLCDDVASAWGKPGSVQAWVTSHIVECYQIDGEDGSCGNKRPPIMAL